MTLIKGLLMRGASNTSFREIQSENLQRSNPDFLDGLNFRSSLKKVRRRPSNSFSSNLYSGSNLHRLRTSSLGQSDPQITTLSPSQSSLCSSSATSVVRLRIKPEFGRLSCSLSPRTVTARRSLNSSTAPMLAQRCRSPVPTQSTPPRMKTNTYGVALRNYAKGICMVPVNDARRWSLASLPSTSGCATPDSNSTFSSEFSSQEHLVDMLNEMQLGQRSESVSANNTVAIEPLLHMRPRSRSLSSPVIFPVDGASASMGNIIYKERFPKAKQKMEHELEKFISENAPLSSVSSKNITSLSRPCSPSVSHPPNSPVVSSPVNSAFVSLSSSSSEQFSVSRIFSEGATRFIHHQIVDIASDCLSKSQEGNLSGNYFCDMSHRLEIVLVEAREKTTLEGLNFLRKIVRNLLMIVSRTARLLECLEFNPDEFYKLLEEAEGAVREQLGAGNAKVPDLPQYILSKLGLNRDSTSCEEEIINKELKPSINSFNDSVFNEARFSKFPSESDFEPIRLISNGAYGAVYLVRHRETRHRYALKKMKKQTLILRNQVDQVYAERDILTFTDNPFVVSFYGSFETRSYFCMLMEYVEGGDCAALLKSVGSLPVEIARLYIAETLLAIDYLHFYGIVHRDLKPDNLLITAMGHVKLTDFGLSKIGLMNRTTLLCENIMDMGDMQQFKDKQLCGTPEYIAPEVILRQGYGKPVDWWALGIILYEFLIGIVPFLRETPESLFENIISEEVEFPTDDEALPIDAEALIRKLLEKNPVDRIGTVGGAQQIMMEAFFTGLDFDSLLRQKAEFVPQLKGEEDTSYFDTRCDRYNHDAESGEDENAPMFGTFDTASPRHSIIAMEANDLELVNTNSETEHLETTFRYSDQDQIPLRADDTNNLQTLQKASEIPTTATVLRRRFSAQRHNNVSTSSSGTTGTGCMNTTCSSTDSSIDVTYYSEFPRRSPLPMESTRKSVSTNSALPRFAISCEPEESGTHVPEKKELSPVEESKARNNEVPHTDESLIAGHFDSTKRTPVGSHLQLVIPSHSTVLSRRQNSPVGSVSSASSIDSSSPKQLLYVNQLDSISPRFSSLKTPIIVKKTTGGFGFAIKSIRIYLGEQSDYYKIEHVVSHVDEDSPAYEAGLRVDDLILYVQSQPVSNMSHPQIMRLLLASGNELSLKTVPLSCTSFREGAARRTEGKLVKRQKRPQRRIPLENKTRKSSLLRRLSSKRASNDIVPGSSSQKQAFMPRSASNQDGMLLSSVPVQPTTIQTSFLGAPSVTSSKKLSDAGISKEQPKNVKPTSQFTLPAVSRPSSLKVLKQKNAADHQVHRQNIPPLQIPVSPLARERNATTNRPKSSRSPSPGLFSNMFGK